MAGQTKRTPKRQAKALLAAVSVDWLRLLRPCSFLPPSPSQLDLWPRITVRSRQRCLRRVQPTAKSVARCVPGPEAGEQRRDEGFSSPEIERAGAGGTGPIVTSLDLDPNSFFCVFGAGPGTESAGNMHQLSACVKSPRQINFCTFSRRCLSSKMCSNWRQCWSWDWCPEAASPAGFAAAPFAPMEPGARIGASTSTAPAFSKVSVSFRVPPSLRGSLSSMSMM